jgi:hypothetical protein
MAQNTDSGENPERDLAARYLPSGSSEKTFYGVF